MLTLYQKGRRPKHKLECMSFQVDFGFTSRKGPREVNEDFAGAMPAPARRPGGGLIAAIADGVSQGGGGLEAAQTSVRTVLEDFYDTPDTWETTVALDRLIGAQNNWLASQNRKREAATLSLNQRGAASARSQAQAQAQTQTQAVASLTTLSALVLEGHRYTVAHVGDTRVWRIGNNQIELLTHDHAYAHPDQRSRLTRAVGLDDLIRVDYQQGEACIGDWFLLTSDGIHGVLGPRQIAQALIGLEPQAACDALTEAALRAGSLDNATALAVRIVALETTTLNDVFFRFARLPALPRLSKGQVFDGFEVIELVADTKVHRLYKAREQRSGELVAIKALHESRTADGQERAMLAHEAWLGLQLTQHQGAGLVPVREAPRASASYLLFDWVEGQSLEQIMATGQKSSVAQIVAAASAIALALGRLHRLGVSHRDLKPSNLHLGSDGQWRLLDLGVAVSGREPASARDLHAGTPSYMNPEQWDGAAADSRSDLFALGVTLYQWICGRLPYGEIEPYQSGRYRRDPQALIAIRPDLPVWLNHLVLRSIALDPKKRFETAEELLLALERGAARPLQSAGSSPLMLRDPVALWKIGLGLSVLINLMLIYWLLFLPR